MRIGLTFPHNVEPTGAAIGALGRAIEDAGFDYICSLDHVAGAHPDRFGDTPYNGYTHETPTHEVMTLFSHLAAITNRIGFATTALILSQRQTALVAKQTAELQLLSAGRLRLGVVIGWNHAEAESMGADFRTRARRMEEQIEVLRRLWTEPLVSFEGRFHRLDRVGINPLPTTPPPIWIGGGYEDALLRRVARLADGWLPSLSSTGDFPGALTRLRSYLIEAGRNASSFGIEVRLNQARLHRERWAAQIGEWQALGATHVAVLPRTDLPASDQLEAAIEAREVLLAAGLGAPA